MRGKLGVGVGYSAVKDLLEELLRRKFYRSISELQTDLDERIA